MKKTLVRGRFLVIALLSVLWISACGALSHKFAPTESSLYIKRDGTFKSALIAPVEGDSYTEEGLKEFVQKEVDTYNAKTGTEGVKLEEASIQDGKAKLIFAYSDAMSLLEFSHDSQDSSIGFTQIRIADASSFESLGVTDAGLTAKVKGKAKVIHVNGIARITTEGRILYAQGKNGEIVHDKHDILTGEGDSYIVIK